MIEIIKNGNEIIFGGKIYVYTGYEKIDELCIHIGLDGDYYCFFGGLLKINGVLKNTSQEIIDSL
jgi:hypothetical protein